MQETRNRRWRDVPVDAALRFLKAEWSGAFLAILILAIAIEVVTTGRPFFHPTNLMTILNNSAALGIVAGGMTLVILTAGIDLSVGSVMGMTAALTGYLVSYLGVSPGLAIAMGISAGAMVGAFHGTMIAYFGMPAFIVTLAGLSIWRGTGHLATGAQATPQLPDTFNSFGRFNPFQPLRDAYNAGELQGYAATLGRFVDDNWISFFRTFQMSMVIFILFFILLALIVSNSKYGRYVYAIGSNPTGARQAGIPTTRYIALTYILCSVSAALGAMLFLGRAPYAKSDYGMMWELEAIAAVVIGGTSLFGGRGSVWGTFMGVVLLKLINNGLTLAQLNTFWQMVVTGLIILIAVALDIVRQSRDADLVRRFLAAMAALMAFLALMTPASLWMTAAISLREHNAMSLLRETAGTLAPGQNARLLGPAEIEAFQAQMAATAVPSALLFAVLVATAFAIWQIGRTATLVAVVAAAAGIAAAFAFGYVPAVPFYVLGLAALVSSLFLVPVFARYAARQEAH